MGPSDAWFAREVCHEAAAKVTGGDHGGNDTRSDQAKNSKALEVLTQSGRHVCNMGPKSMSSCLKSIYRPTLGLISLFTKTGT
jgi:hypothetical protein